MNLARGNGRDLLAGTLTTMYEGGEVEIVPARRRDFQSRFPNAAPIRTLGELRNRTLSLLKSPWQVLLCVAESGAWLLDDPVCRLVTAGRRPVGIITADGVRHEELCAIPHIFVRQLPWYMHNKHMTIRLVENANGELTPDLAIYFDRSNRSTSISPILVNEPTELRMIMEKYTEYWVKAQRYEMGLSEVITDSPEEIWDHQQAMLRELSRVGVAVARGAAA